MPISNSAEIAKRLTQIISQLNQVVSLIENSKTTESKEAVKLSEQGICTYCRGPIEDEKPHRGAHPRCYKRVNRAINGGETTDAQAVSRGWLLEADKGGSKVADTDPIVASSKKPSPRKRKH